MKITSLLLGTVFLLTLGSCDRDNRHANDLDDTTPAAEQKTPVKLIEYLVGHWEVTRAPDQSNQQEIPGDRITFTTEARYIIYDGNQKVDSGAYRMNEQLNNLYLESETDKHPREYELKLDQQQMTLTPKDALAGGKDVQYVYRRVGPASIPPSKQGMAEGQSE